MRRPSTGAIHHFPITTSELRQVEQVLEKKKNHSPQSDRASSRRNSSSSSSRRLNQRGPHRRTMHNHLPPPSTPHHRGRNLFVWIPSSTASPISIRFVCLLSALVVTSLHLYLFVNVMTIQHHRSTNTASSDGSISILQTRNETQAGMNQVYSKESLSLRGSQSVDLDHQLPHQYALNTTIVSLPPISLPPPLRPTSNNPNDDAYTQKMTIRINSWKRPEQLQLSIQHFQSCHGSIALLQVIWCLAQGPVPQWLLELQHNTTTSTTTDNSTPIIPVIVELHELNSLNERFRVLSPIPTAAVLSIDDDVLRPCVALEATFLKWRQNPHRMVGFDARTLERDEKDPDHPIWKYGYLSSTEHMNQYAVTLTRFAILHQHYLDTYMTDLPISIRNFVEQHFNCEDIAMSLWISYQTHNLPPLLADFWAMKTQLKLYSESAISSTNDHKQLRDVCVQQFTTALNLSIPHLLTKWVHYTSRDTWRYAWFDCGAPLEPLQNGTTDGALPLSYHLQHVQDTMEGWKFNQTTHKMMIQTLNQAVRDIAHPAFLRGYLANTEPWKLKFQHGSASVSSSSVNTSSIPSLER